MNGACDSKEMNRRNFPKISLISNNIEKNLPNIFKANFLRSVFTLFRIFISTYPKMKLSIRIQFTFHSSLSNRYDANSSISINQVVLFMVFYGIEV